MGFVRGGQWCEDDATAVDKDGRWERSAALCRHWVRADGSTPFAPEARRYHLWLAWNCTWSQRAWITRNLLGLQDAISISLAHWHRNANGWWFHEGLDALQPDEAQPREQWDRTAGFTESAPDQGLSLWRVYVAGDADYSGRATVPVLWDRTTGRVVSNESADILRMLEREFRALAKPGVELLPDALVDTIDGLNEWIYRDINNGVYRAGFARSQQAYVEAVHALFAALDRVDERLATQRFLCGPHITEADIRLFPTLVRFDPVYFSHFKCSLRRIADYPNLAPYLRDLYQTPGVAETVRTDLYQLGYMGRSERLNPSRIIPAGPQLDWDAPHGREALGEGRSI